MRCFFFFALVLLSLFSCSKSSIEGLWQVEGVSVGGDELTPQGRWVRFDSDGSQVSGNGWRQHSVGTWSMESESSLRVHNVNGFKDRYPAFEVTLQGENMTWEREEEGQEVKVELHRVDVIPTTPADLILGVWGLSKITVNDVDRTEEIDPDAEAFMYLAWESSFRISFSGQGLKRGFFHTDGHRPILELAYYDERPLEAWEYEVTEESLKLSSLSLDSVEVREYERLDYLPR